MIAFLAVLAWQNVSKFLCLVQVRLRAEVPRTPSSAPQVHPGRGLNSWPPDHDSTFHATETPAITTRPSVTSTQTILGYGHSSDVIKSLAICTNAIYRYVNFPLSQKVYLVITFEIKPIGWWFWCLGRCTEGQGIRWCHSFDGGSVCLSVCLFTLRPVCLFAYLSFYLSVRPPICPVCLPVCLSSGLSIWPFISLCDHQADLLYICPTVCLSGLHRGLLHTVTGDCSCLVTFSNHKFYDNSHYFHYIHILKLQYIASWYH